MKIEHDLHVHTHLSSCSSDPKATVENYLRLAKDRGLKLIGFANHFWDTMYPVPLNGISPKILTIL